MPTVAASVVEDLCVLVAVMIPVEVPRAEEVMGRTFVVATNLAEEEEV